MVAEHWDKEMLMGKSGLNAGKGGADAAKEDPMLWGRPGHLTEEQADVYSKFKDEIDKRNDADFTATIYHFGEEEGEVWCLCRWLRARKYVYDDVITMVQEATECRATPKADDFYEEPSKALGCDMALYMAQFPQVYSGYDKRGIPLFFSKPGVLNIDAVDSITTLDGILKFHWFFMMHDFGGRLRAQKVHREGFARFEAVCILDLANLSISQLGSRTLAIIKEQAFIDSLCFPETMAKMVIINAPTFFAATWSIIKGYIDARTSSKVDVYSSRSKWEKKLKELAEEDQIPSDYGGTGPSTIDTMNEASPGDMKRLFTHPFYVRSSGTHKVDIAEGEEVSISVWTRSKAGGKFSIFDNDTKASIDVDVEAKHTGGELPTDKPTETVITTNGKIKGPIKLKISCNSNGGRFTTERFLLAFNIY